MTNKTNALEQCDSRSKSELKYEGLGMKITTLTGNIAKEAWSNMDTQEIDPLNQTFNRLKIYFIKAKFSKNLTCWKYQPTLYVNNIDTGPVNCEVFICHLVEYTQDL